jgi:hypothetical protein
LAIIGGGGSGSGSGGGGSSPISIVARGPCTGAIMLKSVAVFWQQPGFGSQFEGIGDCEGEENDVYYCPPGGPATNGGSIYPVTFDPSTCTATPAAIPDSTPGNGYGTDNYLAGALYSQQIGLPGACYQPTADAVTAALSGISNAELNYPLQAYYGPISGTQDSTARTSVLALLASIDLADIDWGDHVIFMPPLAGYDYTTGVFTPPDNSGPYFTGTPAYNIFRVPPSTLWGPALTDSGSLAASAGPCNSWLVGATAPFPASLAAANDNPVSMYGAVKFAIQLCNTPLCVAKYTANFSCACVAGPCGTPVISKLFSKPPPLFGVASPFQPDPYNGSYYEFEPTQTPDYIEVGWNRNPCGTPCSFQMSANENLCCP